MNEITLVGKPNSGKSSLFNLLTGLNQKIGNYGGVTVEKKSGNFTDFEIIDLPGLKSLRSNTIEEEISRDAILENSKIKSPIIFVANGLQLEDNLILFSEIADLQIPMLLVINFKDDLEKYRIHVDLQNLSNNLGCEVILMNSKTGDGLNKIKQAATNSLFKIPNAFCRSLYDKESDGQFTNQYVSKLILPKDSNSDLVQEDFFKRQKLINSFIKTDLRYNDERDAFLNISKRWDKILLHPIFGILIFLLTILTVFQSVFYFASIPMDWIDLGFAKLAELTQSTISNAWFADIISEGIIPGLAGVLIFIPQIAILFLLLGILEHSGYLSRISFIANRFLSNFGLSGQSVIPLMSSWACAIPAIMSCRVINDPKERFSIIFAAPLMTCSARLPVYTILIAIMFPEPTAGFFNIQGVLLLVLYLVGVFATLLVAKLSYSRSKIKSSHMWSLELPVYRVPNWRNVFYNVYLKTKAFVIEAGKIIFLVSIILWFLASYSPKSDSFLQDAFENQTQISGINNSSKEAIDLEYSYAGYLGKTIEPLIEPLGYDWKIGIALISSFAAREVFVGSISTIYSVGSDKESLIKDRLRNEKNRLTGSSRFNLATCLSLLMFYVFALQCMSTMAIVKKETGHWKYPLIQFVVMLIMAYASAWLVYTLFK